LLTDNKYHPEFAVPVGMEYSDAAQFEEIKIDGSITTAAMF